MRRPHKNDSFTIELEIIIRYCSSNERITESVVSDKVIRSSTLIDALKFIFRNKPVLSSL